MYSHLVSLKRGQDCFIKSGQAVCMMRNGKTIAYFRMEINGTLTLSEKHTRDFTKRAFICCRWEAAQVRRVLESVQPELEPDHAHAQTHWLQAILVRPLRQGVSAQGGPAPTQGLAARRVRWRPRISQLPLQILWWRF